jgi:hypothetical protein
MRRVIGSLALLGAAALTGCNRPADAPKTDSAAAPAAPATPPAGGPHAVVNLTDGSKVPGSIVASTQTEMVVAGDNGIEHRIPLDKVKSVDYNRPQIADASPAVAAREKATAKPAPAERTPTPAPAPNASSSAAPPSVSPPPPPPPAPVATPTTRTSELPAGAEVSVRTNEPIDSAVAQEGQTFDAQVTRDLKDTDNDIVVPRGARANIVIKSASKGGKFRGQSDLVLDLQSVVINGRTYNIETEEVQKKGKSGIGANKRTAEYTGGGAALGAIIGAIAGGGKGAAIGAGAGAAGGAITQVLTKGGAIKVPVESILTFKLERPLRVRATE